MRPFIQKDPEWLPENEAQVLAGQMIPCPDGVTRKVLVMGAARSAALYVYQEGTGPCFLNPDAIATLRDAVRAAARAAQGEGAPPPLESETRGERAPAS